MNWNDIPDYDPTEVVSPPIPVQARVVSNVSRHPTISLLCPVNRLEEVPKWLSYTVQGDFHLVNKLVIGGTCMWTSGVLAGELVEVTPSIHQLFTELSTGECKTRKPTCPSEKKELTSPTVDSE